MQNKYYQLGYGGLGMLFGGLVLAAILFYILYPSFKGRTPVPNVNQCYIANPDPAKDVIVKGVRYSQLRLHTATIKIEVDAHLAPIGKVKDAQGVDRDGYFLWIDGFGGGVGERSGTVKIFPVTRGDDLLFLDVSETEENVPIGHIMTDIYRKADMPIPDFIKEYCRQLPNIGPLLAIQDTAGESYPPLTFNSNDLQILGLPGKIPCANFDGCLPERNREYRLVAWEPYTQRISLEPDGAPGYTTFGLLPVTVDGQKKMYKFNYVSNSPAKFVALFDPDGKTQYDYLPDYLAPYPPIPTIVNLHEKSPIQDQMLQWEAFVPFMIPPWGWWVPECKPAIYLYPLKDMFVNVKVNITNGFLTYTDPLYPKTGWNVLAKPSGDLHYFSNLSDSKGKINYPTGIFPYLYYEAKIQDQAITKPTKGFVKSYDELPSFFDEILPKLGLNPKETSEFKQYWLKALSKANYYFIGIVPQEQLDENEPLTITPKEDTMIRVRLYFEALKQSKLVEQPTITTPKRSGFTVVDWGGMVKADKNHPFTCLQ